jgi:FMN phosphatase YigB (HAD superfamily)
MTLTDSAIHCIIFDFADTLSPTPYFWPLGEDFCAVVTQAIFAGENTTRWASPWCCGTLSSGDIANYLSGLTEYTPERILAGLDDGCANLQLNPAIWRFAQAQRAQGRRTVLATVNMDVFTRVVVPAHGFDQVFDVVVNSADYGTEDKNALCEIAFSQLDDCTFENSLLIDDRQKYLDAFRARGGMACRYTTDEAFAEWAQGSGLAGMEQEVTVGKP